MTLSADFDFLSGRWRVHNRFLNGRLRGSTDWTEFDATCEAEPLANGLGNMDRFQARREGAIVEGLTVRLYNPATRAWSIYWADNVRPGAFTPPMTGKWTGERGEFFGDEDVAGQAVRCRFRWNRADPDRPTWEQAFSRDGAAWETKWVMTFTRLKEAA